jgi:hypothetical protein
MERHTIRSTTFSYIERRGQSSIRDVRSFRGADYDTVHYMVVAKVWERLEVSKQTMHKFHRARFSLKKLNQTGCKEQYRVEISNRFLVLENLDADVDINKLGQLLKRIPKFQLH